jgi:hypothetical protein
MDFKEKNLSELKGYLNELDRICHGIAIEMYLDCIKESNPKEYEIFMKDHQRIKGHLGKLKSNLENYIREIEEKKSSGREE